ncbi:MAG: AAA family ATPase [Prevotellaceae bacterium]|jgi:predicted ATP-dependent endonuclease of OLD family|nr:AAA family ATPase [Prevotellaceae bacterium]
MIRSIKIEKFWAQYNIDWQPYSDVNILVGINGSGKSTLLRILDVALSCRDSARLDLHRFLSHGYALHIEGDNINIKIKDGQDDSLCDNHCKYHFVNTFDEIIKEKKALDQELSPLAARLMAAIFDTHEMSLNSYRLKATESQDASIRINERLQQWITTVNDFFFTTRKTFEIQSNNVFFKRENGEKLSLEHLSAGEKQLLIILTHALIQDQEPFILLMDEPEISLDIDWQYKLIHTIRKFNPSCQLFIATHSPGIFGDGWNDKLVFMEELLQK